MPQDPILFSLFAIFAGAAVIATLALYARQSLLVAYIILGLALGPWGLGVVTDVSIIREIGHIGIIFLLFLLGLNLKPQDLFRMLRKTTLVTVASSLLFAGLGLGVALGFGYKLTESLVIGATLMFSSTIIGLKLLPTTVLHHQHAGRVMVSILLLQDIIAIIVMLVMQGLGQGQIQDSDLVLDLGLLALALPALVGLTYVAARFVLIPLLRRFDKIHEYLFLAAIGWCLGVGQLAEHIGLSFEIGAFVAGVSIAPHPIALFISASLKPLRDFFLIVFFFTLGAAFDLQALPGVLAPALVLAAGALLLKPLVFHWLLVRAGEETGLSREMGVRLGQVSEFSLLVAFTAQHAGVISPEASYLVQLTTLLSFIASSYWVVMRYPTPIAASDRLRRD